MSTPRPSWGIVLWNRLLRSPAWISYSTILIVLGTVACGVHMKCQYDRQQALARYRIECDEDTELEARRVSEGLRTIYENIRTISFLPGVRGIDRHGKNLTPDARQSIQQIYNNLTNSVAVSEVYIVPATLNPDRIDPETGKNEEPILMFDQNEFADPVAKEEPESEEHEEVEIEEYRLLVEQVRRLQGSYGRREQVKGIHVPLVSGREVITCDNTDYDRTLQDDDRKGFMLSVPFYSPEGELKGLVSAVVRTNLLRAMMPKSHCALLNRAYGTLVYPQERGQEHESAAAVSAGLADESLWYSTVASIDAPDTFGEWKLWVGRPRDEYQWNAEVIAAWEFAVGAYAGTSAVLIFALCACWVLRRSAHVSDSMEEQKRLAMRELANSFEARVKSVIQVIASNSQVLLRSADQMAELVGNSSDRAVSVAAESQHSAARIQTIASSVEQMSAACREIAARTAESTAVVRDTVQQVTRAEESSRTLETVSRQIGDVIVLIRNIAGQINLLSLNAAIEASRVGAAGSGFAVVANEVKTLANQTSDAANKVARQIHEVQSVSTTIVEAFAAIRRSIHTVDGSSLTIASAIEEQTATTSEISSTVSAFATGSSQINLDITEVQQSSQTAHGAARNVQEVVHAVAADSQRLETEITQFLADIRPEETLVSSAVSLH